MMRPRPGSIIAAVNPGSFRVSAIIARQEDNGDLTVLGSGHRASQGIRRGYVTDMAAATHAIRDAVERAERIAQTSVQGVWVGCVGAGLASRVNQVEIEIGGRRVEDEDIVQLLDAARDAIEPDGRTVLHAQPACYTLDGAHGVANPKGLHAERLGVDIHLMLADGAPIRNLVEAVQGAHLDVEGVVAAPMASAVACLTEEERELGTALVEIGGDVTNIAFYVGGVLAGLKPIAFGSNDITDAIASSFGIRRFQAERLKCVHGSAISSPTDHREMIPVNGPGEDESGPVGPRARGADDRNRIARADLVAVVTEQLGQLTAQIGRELKAAGFGPAAADKGRTAGGGVVPASASTSGSRIARGAGQVVLTGGGAELAGLAEFVHGALGRPVRIGRPRLLAGVPEAHSTPGFSSLIGLCLHAAEDPIDIRRIARRRQAISTLSLSERLRHLFGVLKENF